MVTLWLWYGYGTVDPRNLAPARRLETGGPASSLFEAYNSYGPPFKFEYVLIVISGEWSKVSASRSP